MLQENNLLLLGAGGHSESIADAVLCAGLFLRVGLVDKEPGLFRFGSIPVVGTDGDLLSLKAQGWGFAFVAVGSIGDTTLRRKLFSKIEACGFHIPNIIDPSAVISANAHLGRGIFVGKNAVVNAGSTIEDGAIVNSGAIIEHDCYLGAFSHAATCSVLCGGVHVGIDTHIGAGAVIKQGIQIGDRCMIGMGSVVIHDVSSEETIAGNPARSLGGWPILFNRHMKSDSLRIVA